MLDKRSLSALLELLYTAATDSAGWDQFLAQYGRAVGAPSNGIILLNPKSKSVDQTVFTGVDPALQQVYDNYYWQTDEWFKSSQGRMRPGAVFFGEELCPESKLLSSEFYNDYLRYSDTMFHQFGGFIAGGEGTIAVVSSLRSRRRGAFGAVQAQTLEILMPHIERALAINHRIMNLQTKGRLLEAALDFFPTAVIFLDATGAPCLLNRKALILVEKNDGLSIRNNRLCATQPNENARLIASVKAAVNFSVDEMAAAGKTVLISRSKGRPLSVLVTPYVCDGANGIPRPVAAMFVTDPDQHELPRWSVLASRYRLTGAECRVAVHLSEGESLNEMSGKFGVSVNTLRTQLQSIYGKTGTSRQAELVRLLLQASLR